MSDTDDSKLFVAEQNSVVDLGELVNAVYEFRWRAIGVVAICIVVSVSYALLATQWYRAEVVLLPAEEQTTPALGSQLDGLASLAGFSVGGADSTEPLAVLRSREFLSGFIDDLNLMPTLFSEKWDSKNERWKSPDAEKWPDIRDGTEFFDRKIYRVAQDTKAGTVTLSVQWKDPELAAEWANEIVGRLNQQMRGKALREAERNIAYLQSEVTSTSLVILQQSISALLESQYQKLMVAKGNEQFAFRVIDKAVVPKYRHKPNRKLIVAIGGVLGLVLGLAVAVSSFSRASRH